MCGLCSCEWQCLMIIFPSLQKPYCHSLESNHSYSSWANVMVRRGEERRGEDKESVSTVCMSSSISNPAQPRRFISWSPVIPRWCRWSLSLFQWIDDYYFSIDVKQQQLFSPNLRCLLIDRRERETQWREVNSVSSMYIDWEGSHGQLGSEETKFDCR